MADERLEPAPIAGRDDDIGVGARAVGEQHIAAIEPLDGGDDLNAPCLDEATKPAS